MALTITHAFVSSVPDAGNPGEIEPSHWNAAHVITGSADPGGPLHSVQFNNPLGTFDGTGDFAWITGAGSGLSIGGAIHGTGNNFTAGTAERMAVGSYAVINHPCFAAGDPFYQGDDNFPSTLLLCEGFSLPGSSIAIYGSYNNTSGPTNGIFTGMFISPSIVSTSTDNLQNFIGEEYEPFNFGSGTIDVMAGIYGGPQHLGGAVNNLYGVFASPIVFKVPNVAAPFANNVYGIYANSGGIGGAGVSVGTFTAGYFNGTAGSAVTNSYGVYIADTGTTSALNENLHSAGASSVNYFEGFINTGGTIVSSLPAPSAYRKGMRYYVTDALGPAFGVAVVGLGGVVTPVFCDGTNWIVG